MDKPTSHIALIDDDPRLVQLVERYLTENGSHHVTALTPAQILNMPILDFDLLILDIMMPEIDGFELLRRLRQVSQVPVIFLSARSDVFDRVVGLELGADDFLPKPFEPRELLARIQAILRRNKSSVPPNLTDSSKDLRAERLGTIQFEEFSFDQDQQTVFIQDKKHMLSTFEFHLLRYFCFNPNIVLSRNQISAWLETQDFGTYDRSIDVGISRLRKKIELIHGKPSILQTVWGRGYQLVVSQK